MDASSNRTEEKRVRTLGGAGGWKARAERAKIEATRDTAREELAANARMQERLQEMRNSGELARARLTEDAQTRRQGMGDAAAMEREAFGQNAETGRRSMDILARRTDAATTRANELADRPTAAALAAYNTTGDPVLARSLMGAFGSNGALDFSKVKAFNPNPSKPEWVRTGTGQDGEPVYGWRTPGVDANPAGADEVRRLLGGGSGATPPPAMAPEHQAPESGNPVAARKIVSGAPSEFVGSALDLPAGPPPPARPSSAAIADEFARSMIAQQAPPPVPSEPEAKKKKPATWRDPFWGERRKKRSEL